MTRPVIQRRLRWSITWQLHGAIGGRTFADVQNYGKIRQAITENID